MTTWNTVETADAFEAAELFEQRGWTDGLPIVPPTAEKVEEFLRIGGLDADQVLLHIPVTNRRVTVLLAAINAVMAGCLPAYFPVVLAAIRGWGDDRWGSGDDSFFYISNTSTGGGGQLLIINGPIRGELGINSGVNLYGPGNRANSTIGRAMRLILINAAGFTPGVVDNACQGHPGKFSFCIAENEEDSPWEPLQVERGYAADVSTVTTVSCRGPEAVENRMTREPEGILLSIADTMSRLGAIVTSIEAPTKVIVMGPEQAHIIADSGWTKQDVKNFLYEHCRKPVADLKRIGMDAVPPDRIAVVDGVDYMRGCSGPEDVLVVVAGAKNAGISSVITNWTYRIPPGDYIVTPIEGGNNG